MRKFRIFIILFFIVSLSLPFQFLCVSAKSSKSLKQKIEFTTKDNFILVGDLYLADSNSQKPLVVLLHSFSLNAYAWLDLINLLKAKNYNVLAMDIRGHGRSVYNEDLKFRSRFKFTSRDWQKLPSDVLQSIAYVKANYTNVNCDRIIFVGADVGASAAVLAGHEMKKYPEKFVLISPMTNFKGLYIPVKVTDFSDAKFMLVASVANQNSFDEMVKLSKFIQTVPVIKQYPNGGAGNQLLKVNPSSYSDIVNFIDAN